MLVSVVIPCFNVELCVSACLDSALSQTYTPIEIICVDNNSTDGTLQILEKYHDRYPELIKVLSETEQGAPAARNKGLAAAQGKWIQFLDADDELLPGKLTRQLQMLKADTDFLIGTPQYVDLIGQVTTFYPWKSAWLGLAHGLRAGHTVANFYSKAILSSLEGWREDLPYLQDPDLLFRLLKKGAKYQLDFTPSCRCHDRPSGKITQQDPPGMYAASILQGNAINQWLAQHEPDYWQLNKHLFYAAILRKVKLLAAYDIDQAMQLARQFLPKGFVPSSNNFFNFGGWHQLAYPLLGLERSERIKHALTKAVESLSKK